MRVRIATRQSNLAIWQAEFLRSKLLDAQPDLAVELVGMTTAGDRWLDKPLSEIGGKGLFVKELEAAMLDGRADMAVHSVKDLPAQLPAGMCLPLLGYRDDVRDVLVGQAGGWQALPQGARVGSSSLRRRAQLLALRPDIQVLAVRGNVETRLRKLRDGDYDALLLAQAGINRLGIDVPDAHALSVDECLPAPGQGALGVECAQDSPLLPLLEQMADPREHRCIEAERGVSMLLGGDCSLPIGALARISGDVIDLSALLAAADGTRILRARAQGTHSDEVAQRVVAELNDQGAQQLLADLREHG